MCQSVNVLVFVTKNVTFKMFHPLVPNECCTRHDGSVSLKVLFCY